MYMGTPLGFLPLFYERQLVSFPLCFPGCKSFIAFPKWSLLLKERICSKWSKFFPLTVEAIENAGKCVNCRDASSESISIYLKKTDKTLVYLKLLCLTSFC